MKRLSTLSLAATLCIACMGQTLEADFTTPPDASKPIMIWQWMDGLISREGIRADLEAYKEAGIGGVQNFQVGGTKYFDKNTPLLPSGLIGPVVVRRVEN